MRCPSSRYDQLPLPLRDVAGAVEARAVVGRMEIEATAAVWEPAAAALPAGVWYESAATHSGDVAEVREAGRCMNIKNAGLL